MAWEWLSIPAGVIAGTASGIGAAWIGRPAAQAAAETARTETEGRLARRRQLIDDAHALISESYNQNAQPYVIARDQRFVRLRPHLSDQIVERYTGKAKLQGVVGNQWSYPDLEAEIDKLARDWKLA
jgi:hypothetical protein